MTRPLDTDKIKTPIAALFEQGLRRGTVIERQKDDPEVYRLRTAAGETTARRAESCLLELESGDVVLLHSTRDEHDYVLALLHRRGETTRNLRAAAGAPVRVSASSLTLVGDEELTVAAPRVQICADEARMTMRALHVASCVIGGASKVLQWVGDRVQTAARQSAHSAGCYTRTVERADTVNSTHLHRSASEVLMTTSRHMITQAKHDMRINAERIHMG